MVRAVPSHSHSTSFPSIAYLPAVTAAAFLYARYSLQYSHIHGCTHMAMCNAPAAVHIRYTSSVSFSSSCAATWYIHLRCDAGMIRSTFHFPWPGIPGHSKDKSYFHPLSVNLYFSVLFFAGNQPRIYLTTFDGHTFHKFFNPRLSIAYTAGIEFDFMLNRFEPLRPEAK